MFLTTCQKKKIYGTLKFLLTQDHMGLEISKCYHTVVIRSEPNFMINKAVIREYSYVLAICQKLKMLLHFV